MYLKRISYNAIAVLSALIITSANAFAQDALTDSLRIDSIANAFDKNIELNEVVVKGASVIKKADRELYLPSAEIIKGSTSGTDLLRKLSIPTLVVNPMDKSIALASQGKLDLRINGRKVDAKQINGIDPKNVIRVEYHDNPSLRYEGAEAVVDFIIKQPTSGGRFNISINQSFNRGFGEYNADLSLNYKKSEFSYNIYSGPRWNMGQWRTNHEYYTRKDGSKYERSEKGIPADYKQLDMWHKLGYNFTDEDKQMFSAQLSLWDDNTPKFNYNGILTNSDTGLSYLAYDKNKYNTTNPSLDLYYQRKLANDQTLMFNVVASMANSNSDRYYTEYLVNDGEPDDVPTTNISTLLNGKTYNLIGEADYEKAWTNSRFTAGAKHTQSWSESTYKLLNITDKMRLSQTYLFAEYWQRLNSKFDITLGLGTSHYYNNDVDVKKTSNWIFRPKLDLRYVPSRTSTIRFDFNSYGNAPSLSELTNVEQVIDNNQTLVGNANLKTYTTYSFKLQYEFNKDWFYGRILAMYRLHNNPIMETKYWGDNSIINTYANHRNAHTQRYELTLRAEPIKNWLTISGVAGFGRYIMHGNDYTHCYNNFYTNSNIEVTHWNFTLVGAIITNRNSFWGETLIGGENIHLLMLFYTHKDLQIGFGAMNPFTNNYKRESENWNKYAGFKRATHITAVQQLVGIQLDWSIQWGRKHKAAQKRLNNDGKSETVKASGKG